MGRRWTRVAGTTLLITIAGAGAGPSEAQEYSLVYGMEEGEEFTVQVARTHRNHRNFMGNELTTNSEELTEYRMFVRSADEDGLELELEFTQRAAVSDDSTVTARADFSDLIGQRVRMLLSRAGAPSRLRGFDDLPEINVPGQDEPVGELRYANEALSLFPRLPRTPVELGDSWSEVLRYEEPIGDVTLPLVVHYDYTLVEETRFDGHDCLRIDARFTADLSGQVSLGGLDLELELDGRGTETTWFAWREGMFVKTTSSAVVGGAAENEEMGVSIPMTHAIVTITTASAAVSRGNAAPKPGGCGETAQHSAPSHPLR